MTEPISSKPRKLQLDLRVWQKAVEQLCQHSQLSGECLKGWSVRVRHSRQEPFQTIGKAFKEVLSKHGAELSAVDDLEHALASPLRPRQLDSIQAFLMIAGTTGVSAEAMELAHEKGSEGAAFSERTVVTLPKCCGEGFIRKRLDHHRVKVQLYEDADVLTGALCARAVSDIVGRKRQIEMLKNKRTPTIGIVTALPLEFDAMVSQLNDIDRHVTRVGDVVRDYVFGTLPALNGGKHEIVVVCAGVGNSISAALTERLFGDFSLHDVLMVGIAGGIPRVESNQDDVRLGDVVISGRKGVVQYDMVKERVSGQQQNHSPMPPSRAWTTIAEAMVNDEKDLRTFNNVLLAQVGMGHRRPPSNTDILRDDRDPGNPTTIRRAKDPRRKNFASLAFVGAVGSANKVVKSHKERERVRKNYNVIAVEMEGAGVAEAAMSNGRPFFVVRGICDYANNFKNDKWHGYAALAAATFAASLIKRMPLST